MTKQEFNSLLMKLNQMYDTASKVTDLTPYSVYNVTRKLLDMVENNNKPKVVQGKLTLVKDK